MGDVGRTPWSAADAPVGLPTSGHGWFHLAKSGPWGSRADRVMGVKITRLPKRSRIRSYRSWAPVWPQLPTAAFHRSDSAQRPTDPLRVGSRLLEVQLCKSSHRDHSANTKRQSHEKSVGAFQRQFAVGSERPVDRDAAGPVVGHGGIRHGCAPHSY